LTDAKHALARNVKTSLTPRTVDELSNKIGDAGSVDVLLVSLPFGILRSPSLALGILQARLNAAGISAKSRHFTLDYAARVGPDLYNKIASGLPRTTDLLGEWIFSHAISPKTTAQQEKYLARVFGARWDSDQSSDEINNGVSNEKTAQLAETVLNLVGTVKEFVEYAASEILKYSPKIVGFTTVFQQNIATIAVASRLRQLRPSLKIVMGGANCEGPMGQELARTFPFIDLIISGEADLVIVPLIQSLLAGEDPHTSLRVQRYVEPASGSGRCIQTRIVTDLNNYVSPSFDDYFRDLSRFWNEDVIKVHIPLETSRGCWWGMTNHCTFCGLNGSTMSFRSRQPADALQEIVENVNRHPGTKICFVDNILDYRYYDSFLPKLAQLGADLNLFYEIKSNVTKPQVNALRDAGVTHIQPGIESFSNQVLKIMKKGVSAIRNIQLLKWCSEFGIRVDWNFLWGFPGEDPNEYQKMALLVPLLCHLQPPARGSEIRLDRFSPNFTRSSELGFFNVRPYEAYYDIYDGVSREAVFNLSYFFQANTEIDGQIEEYTRNLSHAIKRWRASYRRNALIYLELNGRVVIFDSRSMLFGTRVHVLDLLESKILLLCDTARSASSVAKEVPDSLLADITGIIDGLCEKGVMWFDGQQYVSLAVSFTTFLQSRGKIVNLEEAIDKLLSNSNESSSVSSAKNLHFCGLR
jgi:ribosomal peptide maturation radical SAM protein 1